MHPAPLFGLLAALATPALAISREQAQAEWLENVQAAHQPARRDLVERQDAPAPAPQSAGTGQYAPYVVACPENVTWVRPAKGISDGEKAYLAARGDRIDAAVKALTTSHNITTPARRPVIGLAISGGGLRAMQNGLGVTQALINDTSNKHGTAGVLDAVSYFTGLSGGAWGVSTFYANGGQLPTELAKNVWNLSDSYISPSANTAQFFANVSAETQAKHDAGFPTALVDPWGLALANHLNPKEYRLDTSPNLTVSGLLTAVPALANSSLPFPILVAVGLTDSNHSNVPTDADVWEFNPYEFGSWSLSQGKNTGVFTPIEYLGSPVNGGQSNGTCYKGYDQLAFAFGTSSNLFNTLGSIGQPTTLFPAIGNSSALQGPDNIVVSVRNTFQGSDAIASDPIAGQDNLILVDGGLNDQNVPFAPLVTPERHVDAIIAVDSSADTDNHWPDGTALYTTYNVLKNESVANNSTLRFPAVPSVNGFVNGGLNTRPVFFGCNDTDAPLVVYIPNYPYSANSNSSSFTFAYKDDVVAANLASSEQMITLNGTIAAWPTCLTCALTDRANGYTAANRSSACAACFSAFCWDGKDNATKPETYAPAIGVPAFVKAHANLSTAGATSPEKPKSAAVGVQAGHAVLAAAVLAGAAATLF
ncbi:hypothetical protein Q8F55_008449 [Vanrija albida]|uniref:Lysophospholipase n=1 Tax=Vanrija albida TaxID=181172 RepID=A0ABR3PR08_9TREE